MSFFVVFETVFGDSVDDFNMTHWLFDCHKVSFRDTTSLQEIILLARVVKHYSDYLKVSTCIYLKQHLDEIFVSDYIHDLVHYLLPLIIVKYPFRKAFT